MVPTLLRIAAPSLLALACALPAVANTGCIDENSIELHEGHAATAPAAPSMSPREQLHAMVHAAIERSNAVGAARLLEEAAKDDIEEARAEGKPQVNLIGSVSRIGSTVDGIDEGTGRQGRATLSMGAPLYDAGRVSRLVEYRRQLALAAHDGQLNTQEQIALQTVSLALERSRYHLQAEVYRQYASKMSCLVDALQQIVQVDHGRASELVQARKTLEEAQLQADAAKTGERQMAIRLRRFVGDALAQSEGLASVFARLPDVNEILAAAERAPDIAALSAQADALKNYAGVVDAQGKPQVSWAVSGSKAGGVGNPSNWSAGVNVTVPLYNPTVAPQERAARERAQAAQLQRADAVEDRKARVLDVYEQASSAFDRAHRIVSVLQDSDRVREYTLQQWQQLGKRSLFDVMAAEDDHYSLRVSYVNALFDAQEANALLQSLGGGLYGWLQ
jgi:outer membrane protein TolC